MGFVVTREMIRSWKRKGRDLMDVPKLKRDLRNQERQPKGAKATAAEESDSEDVVTIPPDEPTDLMSIDAELRSLQKKLIAAQDYDSARTIRTQIAGVKDVIKTLREQGYYVTQESQMRRGILIGQTIKSLVLKIPAELPQMVIGLEYADAVLKCEDYAYSILTELAAAESHPDEKSDAPT